MAKLEKIPSESFKIAPNGSTKYVTHLSLNWQAMSLYSYEYS